MLHRKYLNLELIIFLKLKLNFRYFVILLALINSLRNWKPQNFIDISKFICKKYNLIPVICGGHSEISLSKINYN